MKVCAHLVVLCIVRTIHVSFNCNPSLFSPPPQRLVLLYYAVSPTSPLLQTTPALTSTNVFETPQQGQKAGVLTPIHGILSPFLLAHYQRDHKKAKASLTNCVYLEDNAVELYGYKFYGSPWQPKFHDWAFNKARGKPLRCVYVCAYVAWVWGYAVTNSVANASALLPGSRAGDIVVKWQCCANQAALFAVLPGTHARRAALLRSFLSPRTEDASTADSDRIPMPIPVNNPPTLAG